MKHDIFLSYRRDGGEALGQLLYDRLTNDGYRPFFDVESMRSGMFNEQIYSVIKECSDVLVLLPANALDRCTNENDWVRKEIEFAIEQNKNIIPIMMWGFKWPESLPQKMKELPFFEGIEANYQLFDATYEKIKSLLNSVSENHPDSDLYEQFKNSFDNLFTKNQEESWIDQVIKKKRKDTKTKDSYSMAESSYGRFRKYVNFTSQDVILKPECISDQLLLRYHETFTVLEPDDGITFALKFTDVVIGQNDGNHSYLFRQLDSSEVDADGNHTFVITGVDHYYPKLHDKVEFTLITVTDQLLIMMAAEMKGDVLSVSKSSTVKLSSKNTGNMDDDNTLDFFTQNGLAKVVDVVGNSQTESSGSDIVSSIYEANRMIYTIVDVEDKQIICPTIKCFPDGTRRILLELKKGHRFLVAQAFDDDDYDQADQYCFLGIAYLLGRYGAKKDIRKAANMFHKAIEQNHDDAISCFELGAMFLHIPSIQDDDLAIEFLSHAVDLGHPGACVELARYWISHGHSELEVQKGINILYQLKRCGFKYYDEDDLDTYLPE